MYNGIDYSCKKELWWEDARSGLLPWNSYIHYNVLCRDTCNQNVHELVKRTILL